MTFLQHLEELRWHFVRSISAIIILAVVAFLFRDILFDKILLYPNNPDFPTNRMFAWIADYLNIPSLKINQHPVQLINIQMAGQFTIHIAVSMIAGVIIAFPYIFYEFWRFVAPALYDTERKYARGGIFYTSALFFIGISFGFFLIVPLSIDFLGGYNISETVLNQINIQSYIATVTSVTLSAGVVFELPIIIFFLSRIGVVTPDMMKKYRRHAIVGALFLAAIITPPDVVSQIMVSVPLIVLYEVSIGISKRVLKNKQKAEINE